MRNKYLIVFSLLITTLFCYAEDKAPRLGSEPRSKRERREDRTKGHLLADPLFTTAKKKNETKGIGVNSYLWKATLETLSFLPKKNIDPFGGTILTDWYTNPSTPHERLKVEALILGRALHVGALKISVFREKKVNGQWVKAATNSETARKLEDTILTRAREFKVSEEIV